MKNKTSFLPVLVLALILGAAQPVKAAESSHETFVPDLQWSFDGPFGTFDRAAMQRGLKVYRQVCAGCHSMKRIAFRNLADLGYDEGQIKTIASEYTFVDGPNEDGEMFERPGIPSDRFPAPFANDNAAKANNGGALPPDLSLITKARHDGPNYVYGILTGYEAPPEGFHLLEGQNYNKTMPGHVIAMAPPLSNDMIVYEDGAPQTVEQYAKDVAHFLSWAAEPEMERRKRAGMNVIIFLLALAGVMYGIKKKIWANVH